MASKCRNCGKPVIADLDMGYYVHMTWKRRQGYMYGESDTKCEKAWPIPEGVLWVGGEKQVHSTGPLTVHWTAEWVRRLRRIAGFFQSV